MYNTIVPAWDVNTHPLETITVPGDGYLIVRAETKTYDNSSDTSFFARRVSVYINNNAVCDAIAGLSAPKSQMEGSDCTSLIVSSGDKISYGSKSATPNGQRSQLLITFVPFKT